MKLSVIGTGYLGATHAAAMAEIGHEVVGIDVDPAKVASLNAGVVPFHEPGLPELLTAMLESGRLRFTTDLAEAADCEVHFLCVGTPQRKGELAADLTYVDAAVTALLPHLAAGSLVAGKSTVPVGTAARLAALVEARGADLAWNPEFLREGKAVADTLHPDRIVLGVTSERAEKLLRDVYTPMVAEGSPVVVTDLPTAELVKVSANSFLATKISFINAIVGGLRGRRRRRDHARRGDRVRRPDRPRVPRGRPRLRRRLPAQGHPGLHGPRRRARARTRR